MTADSDSDESAAVPTRKGLREGIDQARAQVNEATQGAITRTKDGLDQARSSVADAYASAREKARAASRSAADGLDGNPLSALLGGLALGAVLGALLPRTEREAKALGAVGDRIQDAAHEAAGAARDAGRDKLAELGLDRDHARVAIKSLLDGVIAAVGSAGTAAMESARKTGGGDAKP